MVICSLCLMSGKALEDEALGKSKESPVLMIKGTVTINIISMTRIISTKGMILISAMGR